MNFYRDEDGDYWFGDSEGIICVGAHPVHVETAHKNGENWVLGDLMLEVVPLDAATDLHKLELLFTDTEV